MEWIAILKCPITGKDLRLLQPGEISILNEKASRGQVWQADGKLMTATVEKGLITSDERYTYPIINDIVLMLKGLAIVDSQDKLINDIVNVDKELVKDFYDAKGWFAGKSGIYEDAVLYEDLREVSKDYLKKCHDRVGRFLNPSGKYMLDAASGALQYADYLQYSFNYDYRICVDFSFQALTEAKRKLGNKGICILCDMINLPFKDDLIDGFVSLNTVYHIPKDEQVTAIKELYRVLAPKCKGVVVYDWYKHSHWMNLWMLPFRSFVFVKNRLLDTVGKIFGKKGAERRLYFYAHTPKYFKQNLPPHQIKVWRTLSVHFMRYYIHSWFFGKQILNWVYKKEEKHPELFGLKGEYPMMVFEK